LETSKAYDSSRTFPSKMTALEELHSPKEMPGWQAMLFAGVPQEGVVWSVNAGVLNWNSCPAVGCMNKRAPFLADLVVLKLLIERLRLAAPDAGRSGAVLRHAAIQSVQLGEWPSPARPFIFPLNRRSFREMR